MDVSRINLMHTEDWAVLPHLSPAFDLDSWADQEARLIAERYAAEGERADVRKISRDLRVLAKDSATREPLGAFALYLSGLDTSVAVAEVDAVLPDETASEVTPQWMVDHLVSHDFGPPLRSTGSRFPSAPPSASARTSPARRSASSAHGRSSAPFPSASSPKGRRA
ncbi:hypothetical protein ABZ697_27950 [Streptomyces albidoflavus]|uniref:hypothetical protein n=1 Tax=Streptomyces albidoflavus TaxID=1886 RepID=UPI0034046DC2